VQKMQQGEVPIYEPHLDVIFERNIKQKRLTFSTDIEAAVKDAEIIFLALPTPPGEDGSADLSYILGVAEQLGKIITSYKVIVDKSTVPVGTAAKVHAAIAANAKVDFDVVSNPEFLREGFAVDDFMKPDRVVLGLSTDKAKAIMTELYKPFVRQGNPILFMDEKSAELTKYAANSFLATKITFMNEIANFCERVGADVDAVRIGIGSDTRIGKRFLFPGIGYGGSCFPKDVQALVKSGSEAGYKFEIIDAVLRVNNKQKLRLIEKLQNHYGDLKGKNFALWGLAFKPDTDDIREAPSLYIIDALLAAGATVTAFDPEAMKNVAEIYADRISFCENQYDALEGKDALLIATEWGAFRNPDFDQIKNKLASAKIFDGRNLFDLEEMEGKGIYYESIGRETVIG
jgi:UDPglucose 6-dehydrogenase